MIVTTDLETDTTEVVIDVRKITVPPADRAGRPTKEEVRQTVKTTLVTLVIEATMVTPTLTVVKINKLKYLKQ